MRKLGSGEDLRALASAAPLGATKAQLAAWQHAGTAGAAARASGGSSLVGLGALGGGGRLIRRAQGSSGGRQPRATRALLTSPAVGELEKDDDERGR